MSKIDVTKCTRYCADNGKCTAFKGIYLCSERANCYTKRIIKKQMIIDKLNNQLHRYKQVVKEIKEIAEQQVPYINLDQVKTCTEVEYDYAGKIWYLEQKMYKIIQKCEEVND